MQKTERRNSTLNPLPCFQAWEPEALDYMQALSLHFTKNMQVAIPPLAQSALNPKPYTPNPILFLNHVP